ncbi:MAG: hypothetical protein ACXV1K_01135 [Kineosporiaceae bacterium]
MLPNVPEFGVVHVGVLRAGAVVVPMKPCRRSSAAPRRGRPGRRRHGDHPGHIGADGPP